MDLTGFDCDYCSARLPTIGSLSEHRRVWHEPEVVRPRPKRTVRLGDLSTREKDTRLLVQQGAVRKMVAMLEEVSATNQKVKRWLEDFKATYGPRWALLEAAYERTVAPVAESQETREKMDRNVWAKV